MPNKVKQVSISPIFYEQLFHIKVFCTAFMCIQFGFVIFRQKDIGAKAAHKMLVKLTLLEVNNTVILPPLEFPGHSLQTAAQC
jgi:hypothetical protein